ncbi:MFS general substrate transporter [Diplogelasinospora grovesii]|uniref:MFS general substrate transporter n=1 Tax=Diplogelasinospora grovesii TaxID=303347 RepID=A0AAN6N7G8_9PEZI|nr:MFS general substrate transporter [Diplogelasinospora grovesii]
MGGGLLEKSSSSPEGLPAAVEDGVVPEEQTADFERGFRFWAIITGLGVSTLLSLEHTVATTAAPQILQDLDLKENFIWITNAFFVCSGICGGATSGSMLIVGRAIQGAGSGGIVLTVNILVSDLCPLRKRGQYMAVILAIFGIGVALGPFIGGAIAQNTTWRWVFYINLPIGGFNSLVIIYSDNLSFTEKLRRIDLVGNGILMAGTVAASGLVAEPVMPVRLFAHRTSVVVLIINTFLNSTIYFWYLYFLSVYFQAVSLYSPARAGYSLLPQAVAGAPGAMIAAVSLSRWGKFKPIHFIITALGIGIIIDTLLPAFQAPVSEADQAAATSTWGFIRAFGAIWGVAIPAVIFNNRIDEGLYTVSDPTALLLLGGGGAYQQASAAFVQQFSPVVQGEIRALYTSALDRVFWIVEILAGLACLLVFIEREVPLRQQLETQYGMEKGKRAAQANMENGLDNKA